MRWIGTIQNDNFSKEDLSFVKNYKKFLPRGKTDKILDFGCGFGSTLNYLKKNGYVHVLGFDPDSRCFNFCKDHGFQVKTSENPLDFLKENKDTFDLIICKQVAYYFPKELLRDYFKALVEALANGGVLLVEVFNEASVYSKIIKANDQYIGFGYTEFLLDALIINTGIRKWSIIPLPPHGKSPRFFIWSTLRKLWFTLVKISMILERGNSPLNPKILEKNIMLIANK